MGLINKFKGAANKVGHSVTATANKAGRAVNTGINKVSNKYDKTVTQAKTALAKHGGNLRKGLAIAGEVGEAIGASNIANVVPFAGAAIDKGLDNSKKFTDRAEAAIARAEKIANKVPTSTGIKDKVRTGAPKLFG